MVRTSRKIFCIIMLAAYVFYYASANFFYHTHISLNSKVVHSHPFGAKQHNHTASQIQIIEVMAASVFEMSQNISAPNFTPEFANTIILFVKDKVAQLGIHSFVSLRAPPAVC